MKRYVPLEGEKPLKKNLAIKIVSYFCCFAGIVWGMWLPVICYIVVRFLHERIDVEKYDPSWYGKLRTQVGTIALIYVIFYLLMYS